MGKTATLLLKHRPTDERCNEIASHVAKELGATHKNFTWSLSDDLPPGYEVHLADQLSAHKRDLPGSPIYITVVVED